MRTTLDLPDPLLRELKSRAAQNGQSLKSLLNELIQRALRLPPMPDPGPQNTSDLPILKRLQQEQPVAAQTNEQFEDPLLQEDIEKLRRIGFIK
jgi:hypothetical protein